MKINIAAAIGLLILFFVSPPLMGASLGTMAVWFSLVYYGYKGSMKVSGLASPFFAFFSTVVANMIYLALFGSPDSNTQTGMALLFGVPMLLSLGVVKIFYAFEAGQPKPENIADTPTAQSQNEG